MGLQIVEKQLVQTMEDLELSWLSTDFWFGNES